MSNRDLILVEKNNPVIMSRIISTFPWRDNFFFFFFFEQEKPDRFLPRESREGGFIRNLEISLLRSSDKVFPEGARIRHVEKSGWWNDMLILHCAQTMSHRRGKREEYRGGRLEVGSSMIRQRYL